MTKRPLALIATGACVALMAACSSSSTNTSSTSAAAGSGGKITVGAANTIKVLNPVLKSNAWEQVLFSLMWDGLVKTGQDNKIQPDLATTWTSSTDLKTWTFTLRKDVKFSNGTALTPQSVVDTFTYYKNPTTTTQLKNNVAPISKVVASGDDQVVFTLSTANAVFPASIELVKIIDTASLSTIEKTPAVTGPYKVKEFVSDDHLTLVANPAYFGEQPKIGEIDLVKAADSSSAVTALQSGDLDVLWSVPLSQVDAIKNDSSLQVVTPELIGQYVSWEVDMTAPPFNNVKARQALAYAIDRDAILKNAYYGQGVVSKTNNPLTDNNPAFGGTLTDYSYDLDKAKALFAEAGVTSGSSITWWGASNAYPEWNTSAQILQASLKKIGITLNIQNSDIATWPNKFYPAGKSYPGLVVPNFQSYQAVPSDLFLFLQSGRCECNWNDKAFDSLYTQALSSASESAQNAVWAKAQELVNQQVPIYVPVQFNTVTAAASKVKGLWVDSGGTPHFDSASVSSS